MCYEFDQVKREELKHLKERQLLRENCPELRDLESQLRSAYIAKETRAQIAEREAAILENKLQEKCANAVLRAAWENDEEFNRKLMEEEIAKKAKLRQEIQDQLMFKENQKRFEYEEFLREKKMLDDVVQRVHDEDQRFVCSLLGKCGQNAIIFFLRRFSTERFLRKKLKLND